MKNTRKSVQAITQAKPPGIFTRYPATPPIYTDYTSKDSEQRASEAQENGRSEEAPA